MAHQLFDVWPSLEPRLPVARLAELPTPVSPLVDARGEIEGAYVKRDDLTSPVYGGNKVRTLEVLFGRARERGATRVFSTGAFGSNHALATVLHAPRAGLAGGALLFPQPYSGAALENLRVTVTRSDRFVALPHWSALPFGVAYLNWSERSRGQVPFVMVPGGATPVGALGYVGAAFELARQVERGELPRPARVVVGVGSTCSSAGLLAGFTLAARAGIGFRDAAGREAPPLLVSARVTPWPVTAAFRIVGLAVRTTRLLASLSGDARAALEPGELASRLRVEGRFLGPGYGHPLRSGGAVRERFLALGGPELDTTYTEKSAAAFLDVAGSSRGEPVVYWATKSTAPLPNVSVPEGAPRGALRWIREAERRLVLGGS